MAQIPGFHPHPLGLSANAEAIQELRDGLAMAMARYTAELSPYAGEHDFTMDRAQDRIIDGIVPGLVELLDARLADLEDHGEARR